MIIIIIIIELSTGFWNLISEDSISAEAVV
jgi:hypothetical protein